ncbi:transmembrane protein 161B-like [Asterias amurensis]|uniref:transmembrane protein 161B-like n=1 Tax=Asterias amurensis TaxID=7602 RepID=UPI003AB8D6A1
MALFGAQLILTIIAASILQKFTPYHSLAEWLLARGNLVRYMYPKDEELRKLAGITVSKARHRKNRSDHRRPNLLENTEDKSFTVPKSIELELRTRIIEPFHVVVLRFYDEYRWLVDFSVMAMIVYCITEAGLHTVGELNLSLIWLLMVTGFALHVLISLTALYFSSEEDGERSLCITFGFFFVLVAMGVLIVPEEILDFGLDEAYTNFTSGAMEFLKQQDLQFSGPISKIAFKSLLGIVAALLGALLAFPGLRIAKMHVDSIKFAVNRPFMQILLHTSFLFPMFISLMWVRPIARDYICRVAPGKTEPIMSDTTFDLVRMSLVPMLCILRVLLMTHYLQSYLNIAKEKVEKLKMEAGRINSLELQKSVVRVFYYLCVVTLQYIAPMLILLSFTCLLKSLGGYSTGLFEVSSGNTTTIPHKPSPTAPSNQAVTEGAEHFKVALESLRNVFSPIFFRGIFSFLTWWTSSAWFITSLFGIAYHMYFTDP